MNTQLKPAEAKHLSIAEYNRFCEWWKGSAFRGNADVRRVALKAYILATEPIK